MNDNVIQLEGIRKMPNIQPPSTARITLTWVFAFPVMVMLLAMWMLLAAMAAILIPVASVILRLSGYVSRKREIR